MPMPIRRWIILTLLISGCVMLSSLATAVVLSLVDRGTSIRILAQDDAGQVAMRDGRLSIYTKVDRQRACHSETSYWLFSMVDHGAERVRLWVPIAGYGPLPIADLGVTSYVLSVPLPSGLWPSQWFWITDRVEYCGLLGWMFPRRYESPPLEIDIERARAAPDLPVLGEHNGKTVVRSRSPLAPLTKGQ